MDGDKTTVKVCWQFQPPPAAAEAVMMVTAIFWQRQFRQRLLSKCVFDRDREGAVAKLAKVDTNTLLRCVSYSIHLLT